MILSWLLGAANLMSGSVCCSKEPASIPQSPV